MHPLPFALRCYILGLGLLGAGCGAAVAYHGEPADPQLTGVILALTLIFSVWRVELTVARGKMTLSFAAVAVALLLDGPNLALLSAVVGSLVPSFVVRDSGSGGLKLRLPPLHMPLFNIANCTVACSLSSLCFSSIAGAEEGSGLASVLGVAAFTALYFFLNTAGVALACALQQKERWSRVWRENFLWTGPGFFASASAALMVAYLHQTLGLWALVGLPPVWVVYFSYRLYMERLHLFTEKVQRDKDHIQQLNQLNQSIIASLATAIDAKDSYTCSHINRVRIYAEHLARSAQVDDSMYQAVVTGALVHDIGKLGIPESILGKPGKLSADEYRRMQKHVTIGVEILSPIPFPFPVLDVVRSHHERWDGMGYPDGLKGEEIPMGARIIAIVDVFDALTSDRPYRKAMPLDAAVTALQENAGKHFDPRLVELFIQALPEATAEIQNSEAAEAEGAVDSQEQRPTAFQEISQAAAEIAAASDVARALSEQQSSQRIQEVVVSRALVLLPVETAVFFSLAEDGMLRATSVAGMHSERLANMQIAFGEGASGHAAQDQQMASNAAAALDIGRRFRPTENIELSLATAVPVLGDGRILGVLTVYSVGYTLLSEHHFHILNTLSEHAASALGNSMRLERHQELANTDPLTGLVNTRGLLSHIDEFVGCGREFSLVMLDLDHFKKVNDTFGHLRGDDLLREIASLLRVELRPEDVAARYAGDEFVVLLPGAERFQAQIVAERIERAVRVLPPVGGEVQIGASLGVAAFPADGEDSKSLIAAADRRMYEDKFQRKAGALVAP